MTPPPPLFHALLRPAVLQILRATGYHSAKTSVLDSVTDLAARYLLHLCQLTALYATHNNDEPSPFLPENGAPPPNPVVPAPTIVDVRMALQRSGALLPERIPEEQEYLGEEDTRGVEAFIAWATGPLNREIKRIALDGIDEAGDYLDGEPCFFVPRVD
jgi:transcription initiation factor TFIID subunit 3